MAKAVDVKNQGVFKMGEPYFCEQCNREHHKGKIYKDHLKYAQNSDIESSEEDLEDEVKQDETEEEEEEIDTSLDDSELDADDSELDADDSELDADDSELDADDSDLLEEYEDYEKEEEEDDEQSIDIEEEINNCLEAVKKLPGVGDATFRKLKKAGFQSLESLAFTPPSIVKEASGLGDKTVASIIKSSMKELNIGFKSADEVWDLRKNIAKVSTGSQELDNLFGGGIETGSLTELFGEFRTGKTQIMHQLCVNVQLPREKGGLQGGALYVDTEGTFRPERIIQMAEALDLDHQKILKNVIFGRAYNSDHQILLIKEAANLIREKNIKLIIVDSLIGHFRSEYAGRGTLANRQQTINQHMHDLLRLCDIHPDLAIVVSNQVSARPDVFYGNPLTATGGNIVAHGSTIRVYLRKGKGEQRIAKIVDAPHLPEGEAVFSITEDGIKD